MSLLHKLFTEELGFCCLYAGLYANRRIRDEKLALRLGVHQTTVCRARQKIKKGEVCCQSLPRKCMKLYFK